MARSEVTPAGRAATGRADESGFTYIAVLAMLFIVSLGLSQLGPAWAHQVQREREQELLRIGATYVQALASYHQASPGSLKQFPKSLDELLRDERHLGIRRHLRRVYTDPLQPGQPFGLLRGEDGTIQGVYSTRAEPPLRQAAQTPAGGEPLPAGARSYRDWVFTPRIESPVQAPVETPVKAP